MYVRQRFARYLCSLGINHTSRDTILEHTKRHPTHGPVHEVDRATYPEFGRAMGWKDLPSFPECTPTLRDPITAVRAQVRVNALHLDPPPKREAKKY